MNKPELEDFGVRPDDWALWSRDSSAGEKDDAPGCILTLMPVGVLILATWALFDGGAAMVVGIISIVPAGFLWMWVKDELTSLRRSILMKSSRAPRIRQYEDALAAYTEEERKVEEQRREAERQGREAQRARRVAERARQEAEKAHRRKLMDHWLSLDGQQLEDEMEALCSRLGYRVETTPVSGDGGVDLILRSSGGRKVVVQCKSYKSPVGPSAVRELYGSMMHFGADRALLVCPVGFTSGVVDFAKGKPIDLVSVRELIELAASAADRRYGEQ